MSTLTDIVRDEARLLGYPNMKDEQLQVVNDVLLGRDVFAVLPTGFGKSLCFACLPGVFNHIMGVQMSIVVVISPLIAIMKDQVHS